MFSFKKTFTKKQYHRLDCIISGTYQKDYTTEELSNLLRDMPVNNIGVILLLIINRLNGKKI